MNVESTESLITAWLAAQQDATIDVLRRMVDIDSGSYDKPGIDRVGGGVSEFLAAHGIEVETIPQPHHGDCLRATVKWDGPRGNAGGNVVLMGLGTRFSPPARSPGGRSRSATASR